MGTSSHSLMTTTAQNERDIALRHPESLGDFGLAHRSFEASNFSDFIGGQQLAVPCDAADVDSVLLVASVIDPFKIGSEGMYLHAIDVIDHRQIEWIGNEGHSYQTVDISRFALAASEQVELRVSDFIDAGLQYLPVNVTGSAHSVANSIHASDTPKIANFVEITEFGDGDTPPFFDEHNMGPFARSAHIIASFCVHQGD